MGRSVGDQLWWYRDERDDTTGRKIDKVRSSQFVVLGCRREPERNAGGVGGQV